MWGPRIAIVRLIPERREPSRNPISPASLENVHGTIGQVASHCRRGGGAQGRGGGVHVALPSVCRESLRHSRGCSESPKQSCLDCRAETELWP